MNRHLLGLCLPLFGLIANAFGTELPEPVSDSDFRALSEHSPFSRPIDLSETLALTGYARIGEEAIITLRDQESKKSHLVSADSNDQGWKLVEVSSDGGERPENYFAEIAVPGGEVVEIRFDGDRLEADHMRSRAGGKNGGPLQDNRLPASKEDREKWIKYARDRMSKMSEEQRKQVGRIMQEKMQGSGSQMSDRQKGETFQRILDHVDKQSGKKK